jgi:predicted NAD-dependent protein-ADP-ribosyltransferase YbiA (DUF1768 family)
MSVTETIFPPIPADGRILYYGRDRDGQGLNWAGRILMDVRRYLRG